MSGGYFNYEQYKLSYIADEIDHLIIEHENKSEEESDNFGYEFSDETITEFKKGLEYLRLAQIYAHRIDWLVSGDDGEEFFHKRLKHDLEHK